MKREEKSKLIAGLTKQINGTSHFYFADASGLNAEETLDLRRMCFNKQVKMVVAKNTLFKRALNESDREIEGLESILKGPTAVMFAETGNAPAKIIKEFREKDKKREKPLIKGAFVEEELYVGDEQLENLVAVKSKEELIADVVSLLQSPMKNVIGALQSGGNTLTGILKSLEEKE